MYLCVSVSGNFKTWQGLGKDLTDREKEEVQDGKLKY